MQNKGWLPPSTHLFWKHILENVESHVAPQNIILSSASAYPISTANLNSAPPPGSDPDEIIRARCHGQAMTTQWTMSTSSAILFVIHIDGILPTLCGISAVTFTSLHLQNSRVQMTLHRVQELNALINMQLKSSPSNKHERDSPCVRVLIDGGENRNHKPGQGEVSITTLSLLNSRNQACGWSLFITCMDRLFELQSRNAMQILRKTYQHVRLHLGKSKLNVLKSTQLVPDPSQRKRSQVEQPYTTASTAEPPSCSTRAASLTASTKPQVLITTGMVTCNFRNDNREDIQRLGPRIVVNCTKLLP